MYCDAGVRMLIYLHLSLASTAKDKSTGDDCLVLIFNKFITHESKFLYRIKCIF